MTVASYAGRRWTLADLGSFPDDGRRYEIIHGELTVSPFAGRRHQRVVTAILLALTLDESKPADLEVFGPTNLDRPPDSHVEPDLVVVRAEDVDLPEGQVIPLLVVEVLSPATRSHDQIAKRRLYAELGIPSYWVVDPESLVTTALELDPDGSYRRVGVAAPGTECRLSRPFPITLRPDDLLPRLRRPLD